jgi:hypothetical protein
MKQKMRDTGSPEQGKSAPTSGDGVLKDLATKAAAMAPALATEVSSDPRRRGEIKIVGITSSKYDLYIDNVLWSEVEWSHNRYAWCIQDCCGYCLNHIEHIHAIVPNDGVPDRKINDPRQFNPSTALETAKQMIRNGSLPSPEDARKAFKDRTGHTFTAR